MKFELQLHARTEISAASEQEAYAQAVILRDAAEAAIQATHKSYITLGPLEDDEPKEPSA